MGEAVGRRRVVILRTAQNAVTQHMKSSIYDRAMKSTMSTIRCNATYFPKVISVILVTVISPSTRLGESNALSLD